MYTTPVSGIQTKQQGTILVFTALALAMLFAFAALAIDTGVLLVSRNELQNAADAGALAGTRVLYVNNGANVNDGSFGVPSVETTGRAAACPTRC